MISLPPLYFTMKSNVQKVIDTTASPFNCGEDLLLWLSLDHIEKHSSPAMKDALVEWMEHMDTWAEHWNGNV